MHTANDYEKTLKKNHFNPETVRFVRPVARQNNWKYTLRMIVNVSNIWKEKISMRF